MAESAVRHGSKLRVSQFAAQLRFAPCLPAVLTHPSLTSLHLSSSGCRLHFSSFILRQSLLRKSVPFCPLETAAASFAPGVAVTSSRTRSGRVWSPP